jgi:hypothetical protein
MDQVCLGGANDLIAEITHGDTQESDRVWVCVRSTASPDKGWIGCWSRMCATRDEVDQILQKLARITADDVSMGPCGPVLNEHYFFPGWQTWGPGLPSPLREIK